MGASKIERETRLIPFDFARDPGSNEQYITYGSLGKVSGPKPVYHWNSLEMSRLGRLSRREASI